MENVTLLVDSGTIRAHHLGLSTADAQPGMASTSAGIHVDLTDPAWTLSRIEQEVIKQALDRTGGNVSEAAKLLGLSRGALRRRLEHLNDPVQ